MGLTDVFKELQEESMMKVGAGKSVLKFPESIFPIEKFGGIHDDLFVRVLVIEDHTTAVIVTVEMTSLQPYLIKKLKEIVSDAYGIDESQIWICVSHTFCAPHTRSLEALEKADENLKAKNASFCSLIEDSLREAMHKAFDTLQECHIGFGNGYCSVNVNRDVHTKDGWWLGANDLGFSDKTIPIIKFEDKKNKPIAILFSCDVQSSIMDGAQLENGQSLISGDLSGVACKYLEDQYGKEFVALFVVGGAGDQSPIFKARHNIVDRSGTIHTHDIKNDGFVFVNALGKKLGNQVMIANEKIRYFPMDNKLDIASFPISCPGQKIPKRIADIKPTNEYEYFPDEDRELVVNSIILGDIAIVGVAPELSSFTAATLKKMSPYPLTMVLTLVNGAAKYMADNISYDRITYEAMNSMFARGAAEQFVEETAKILNEKRREII